MTLEFLEGLQLEETTAQAILQAHQETVQQLQFTHSLERAISQAGGRSQKAIEALLDLPALQQAPDTISDALQALKQEQPYLFESPVLPVYARSTGTHNPAPQEPTTLAGALRERFAKK